MKETETGAQSDKYSFRIGGMTCVNCQNRIEKKLKDTAGVLNASVSYETAAAEVAYDASALTQGEIKAAVESLGYNVLGEKEKTPFLRVAGILVIIVALAMILHAFGTGRLARAFPVAEEGMGYGMLLIIGLLTSVHCIGMCGGINLTQTLKKEQSAKSKVQSEDLVRGIENEQQSISRFSFLTSLFPAFLYNGGRLISYTAVGVAVGALGSVITVSGRFQGFVQLIAGVFMLVMGINMLGLFPSLRRFIPRMPKFFTRKGKGPAARGPLVVGILNGFMPCGPLQAMQLYALGTGSAVKGGVSMFLFCLGTIPLMFALGAAGGILSGAKGQVFSRRVMQVGAVIIAAMGLTMFSNGWGLAGFSGPSGRIFMTPASLRNEGGAFVPEIRDGVQIVNSTLFPGRYPAIAVRQGIPVRWTINAPPGSINGCNNRFIIREYGIEHTFRPGDNVIEFMPAKKGRIPYSCWMGMIRSTITVVAEGESVADWAANAAAEPSVTPVPAGVEIPTDEIALAQMVTQGNRSFQTVEIRLTDGGFEPAVVVMQRQLPAIWNINIDSPEPGNESLVIPAYYAVLETGQGNNPLQFFPSDDFDFSTGDNVFYGFVKVVDDINRADIAAIKDQVRDHETMVYPDAYFELAMSGSGGGGCPCCSR